MKNMNDITEVRKGIAQLWSAIFDRTCHILGDISYYSQPLITKQIDIFYENIY